MGCERLKEAWKSASEIETKHSIEDAEGLLQTLLLMSALLLSFVAGALLSFDKEAYLEMDRQELTSIYYTDQVSDQSKDLGDKFNILKSASIMHFGLLSLYLFLFCCAAASATYISLSYSDCREDPKAFQIWFNYFKWVIFLEYLVFLGGIIGFYLTIRHCVSGAFPAYCVPTTTVVRIGNVGYSVSSLNNIFNATSKELIQVEPTWSHSFDGGDYILRRGVDGSKGPYWHKNGQIKCSEVPKNIAWAWGYIGTNSIIGTFIGIIVLGIALDWYQKVKKMKQNSLIAPQQTADDETKPSSPNSQQISTEEIITLIKKQNALLEILAARLPQQNSRDK